jgi:hypothetical protein
MRQRGRKSAAALSVIPVEGKPNRLQPPASLSEAERKVFVDLVTACEPQHFRPADLPLLVRYVEACVLADQAAEQLRLGAVIDGKPSPWITIQEKAVRAIVALSVTAEPDRSQNAGPAAGLRRAKAVGASAG